MERGVQVEVGVALGSGNFELAAAQQATSAAALKAAPFPRATRNFSPRWGGGGEGGVWIDPPPLACSPAHPPPAFSVNLAVTLESLCFFYDALTLARACARAAAQKVTAQTTLMVVLATLVSAR